MYRITSGRLYPISPFIQSCCTARKSLFLGSSKSMTVTRPGSSFPSSFSKVTGIPSRSILYTSMFALIRVIALLPLASSCSAISIAADGRLGLSFSRCFRRISRNTTSDLSFRPDLSFKSSASAVKQFSLRHGNGCEDNSSITAISISSSDKKFFMSCVLFSLLAPWWPNYFCFWANLGPILTPPKPLINSTFTYLSIVFSPNVAPWWPN